MLVHSPLLIRQLRSKYFARLCQKQHRFYFHPSRPGRMSYLPLKNFLALCASNYYDGCLFHRNIKGFMTQAGDPTGTGKGGQSIWGKPFPDEIRSTLKVLELHPFFFLRSTRRLWFPWRLSMLIHPPDSLTRVASLQWQILVQIPTSPSSSSHMLNSHTLIQNIPSLER